MNKGKPENSFNISKNQEFELITSAYRKTGIRDPTKTGKPGPQRDPTKTGKLGPQRDPTKTGKLGPQRDPTKPGKSGP